MNYYAQNGLTKSARFVRTAADMQRVRDGQDYTVPEVANHRKIVADAIVRIVTVKG